MPLYCARLCSSGVTPVVCSSGRPSGMTAPMSSAIPSIRIPARASSSSGAAAAAAPSSSRASPTASSPKTTLRRRFFSQPPRPPRSLVRAPAAPDQSAGEAVAALLAAAVSGDETTLLNFVAEEAAVSIAERTAQRRRRERRREEEAATSGGKGGGGDRGAEGGSDGGEENSQPQPQPPLLLTPLTLEDVVRAAQPHELSLDSFAVRSLLLCAKPLRGAVAVSGLSPAPGKFVARAAVSLSSGEEMTLTLSLVEEERAVAHYKSVRTERHWALVSARGEPCSSAEEGKSKNDAKSVRDARHGPEVVLDAFLSALSRGDGATVFGLTGLRAGAGARALADAVGGSLFAASIDQGGEEEEEEEEEGGGGDGGGGGGGGGGESVPPWLRGSDNGGGDDGGDSPSSSPSSSRRRFPRELEPLVALFLSGSRYDLLSVKMLSARQAWGMAGVRPLGDDGSGFVLGGSGAAPPSAPPPSSSSSPSPSPSVEQGGGGGEPSPSQQPRQKQWQDNLPQQSERAAFIFRLELCAADGSWEVRDVARVGGGGLSGGGAFSLGG